MNMPDKYGRKFKVGIASASYPYDIDWIKVGFDSYDDADDWVYEQRPELYRNIHIQAE